MAAIRVTSHPVRWPLVLVQLPVRITTKTTDDRTVGYQLHRPGPEVVKERVVWALTTAAVTVPLTIRTSKIAKMEMMAERKRTTKRMITGCTASIAIYSSQLLTLTALTGSTIASAGHVTALHRAKEFHLHNAGDEPVNKRPEVASLTSSVHHR